MTVGVAGKGVRELWIVAGMEVSVGGDGVDINCMIEGPSVASAASVSTTSVRAKAVLVSITYVGLIVGGDMKPLQEVKITIAVNKGIIALPMIFTFLLPLIFSTEQPNELRIDAAEMDEVKTEGTVCRRINPS